MTSDRQTDSEIIEITKINRVATFYETQCSRQACTQSYR